MTRSATKPTVLIVGLDTIRHKNLHQFNALNGQYNFIVLTTDELGDSKDIVEETSNVRLIKTRYGFKGTLYLLKLLQVIAINRIHLVEIYPYSHCALIAAFLFKLIGIPTIAIARGEEYNYVQGKMSPSRAFVFKKTYSLVDHAIYKELYLDSFFSEANISSRFFLHNAVTLPPKAHRQNTRGCTFLFLNSFKDFRHPETPLKAFINLCKKLRLTADSPYRLLLVGTQGEGAPPDVEEKEAEIRSILSTNKDVPVELLPWTRNSHEYFEKADVFLLPADVVFLNYSLLEAMGYGLVPFVQDTPDSNRIFTDGEAGRILTNDVAAWESAMESIMSDPDQRTELGKAARARIQASFSFEAYRNAYAAIYKQVIS